MLRNNFNRNLLISLSVHLLIIYLLVFASDIKSSTNYNMINTEKVIKINSLDYKDINKCESLGTLELICDLQNPEDFAKIPGENSVVVSQFAGLPALNKGKTLIGKLSKLLLGSIFLLSEISFMFSPCIFT